MSPRISPEDEGKSILQNNVIFKDLRLLTLLKQVIDKIWKHKSENNAFWDLMFTTVQFGKRCYPSNYYMIRIYLMTLYKYYVSQLCDTLKL